MKAGGAAAAAGKCKRVILHFTGPSNEFGNGIADYCDNLVAAQRRQGEEAFYVLGDHVVNQGKIDPNRHISTSAWSDDKSVNQRQLEEIEQNVAQQFPGAEVVWYVHLAPPASGTIVSPEWLSARNVTGTIHECKDPSKTANEQERQKAQRKFNETVEYAKSFSSYMISNEEESRRLQEHGVQGIRIVQAIPPNIDPRIAEVTAPERRQNDVVHFGMIRAKKGIETVLAVQRTLDGQGIRTQLAGKVTVEYFDMFTNILTEIYGREQVERALSSTEFQNLFGASAEKETFAAKAPEIVNILNQKCPKRLTDVEFHPNAEIRKVFELLAANKVAYLPFDRGATFHSGSLPACILSDIAVVTTAGDDTPHDYRERLRITRDSADAASTISSLMTSEALLQEQLSRQAFLKLLYPQWRDVARTSVNLCSVAIDVKQQAKVRSQAVDLSSVRAPHASVSRRRQATIEEQIVAEARRRTLEEARENQRRAQQSSVSFPHARGARRQARMTDEDMERIAEARRRTLEEARENQRRAQQSSVSFPHARGARSQPEDVMTIEEQIVAEARRRTLEEARENQRRAQQSSVSFPHARGARRQARMTDEDMERIAEARRRTLEEARENQRRAQQSSVSFPHARGARSQPEDVMTIEEQRRRALEARRQAILASTVAAKEAEQNKKEAVATHLDHLFHQRQFSTHIPQKPGSHSKTGGGRTGGF